jgi:outer membrane lipoprotein-sorting protein
MSFFAEHPRTRWAVPVVAVAAIGATTFVTSRTASADAGLPARSAAQLLADVSQSRLQSLSGTVVQTADLGLPQIPGLAGSTGGGGDTSLTSVVSGTHTWRVWLAGKAQQRLALVGSLGESDVIHNGQDLWLWSSKDKTAVHHTLSADEQKAAPGPGTTTLPRTPQEAADMALAAMSPTTDVTTSGTAVVAGRQAYELVLKPKDAATRIASVRVAIDSEKHIPLRVQIYSTKIANPAFEVGFTAVDFATPDARQFAFNPPSGTTVTESNALAGHRPMTTNPSGTKPAAKPGAPSPSPATRAAGKPKVVGTGWSSVVVATLPARDAGADQQSQLAGILRAVPKVSGAWGSGRVVDGTLFSAVLTDDGRVAVGAVAPEQLYAALAAK